MATNLISNLVPGLDVDFRTLTIDGDTTLGSGADDSFTLNAGVISRPNIPCFLAHNTAQDANQTGNGGVAEIDFDEEIFDQGNDFSADVFTAPTTGKYLLITAVSVSGVTSSASLATVKMVTSNRTYELRTAQLVAGNNLFQNLVLADMDGSDTAKVQVIIEGESDDVVDIDPSASSTDLRTYFMGVQIA